MHQLDPIPAIRRIETDRADCSAFEIVGYITAADVENFVGLLQGAVALHDQIDLLVRIVDHDGVDWGRVSGETLAEGRRLAQQHVRRCAAVGEPAWVPSITGIFAGAKVELKHFTLDEKDEAWTWIGARPVDV